MCPQCVLCGSRFSCLVPAMPGRVFLALLASWREARLKSIDLAEPQSTQRRQNRLVSYEKYFVKNVEEIFRGIELCIGNQQVKCLF